MKWLSPGRRWAGRAPLVVMALVLLLTTAMSLVIASFVHAQQENRFERETSAYTDAMVARLSEYERLLYATRAAWRVHPDLLDGPDFRSFVTGLELQRQYPGVQTIGYAALLPPGVDPGPLVSRLRQHVAADWTLRQGPSPQPTRVPISLLATTGAAEYRAQGYDLYSEPVRRAML
ncbi:CHASE domain-containing protein, partial [Deinococcus sp.]|uniref:CHASE domain-containing protein n=1 Tax=Deinococcus sp. TaxID=47478 RepID=UPI002869876E